MKFIEKRNGEIAILALKGKLLGPPETDMLHEKVKSLLNENVKKIIIDLRYVTWMGSLGIGALMRCLTTVRNAQGDLRLAGLTDKVRSLFSITRMIGIIQIYDNSNQAIESFNTDS